MRKVILENKEPQIHVSDLTNNSIVAILWTDGIKSYFAKEGNQVIHIGNKNNTLYPMNGFNNVVDFILDLGSGGIVYNFSDMKELFKWLSE